MSPNLKSRIYRGESFTVSYNIHRCIHAEECVRRLGEVFDLNERPWIQPDQASPEQSEDMIPHFPFGALQYERLDGGSNEEVPTVNIIIRSFDKYRLRSINCNLHRHEFPNQMNSRLVFIL